MNGKYGGGGFPFTPAALMNDGLFDVCFKQDNQIKTLDLIKIYTDVMSNCGTHVYDP